MWCVDSVFKLKSKPKGRSQSLMYRGLSGICDSRDCYRGSRRLWRWGQGDAYTGRLRGSNRSDDSPLPFAPKPLIGTIPADGEAFVNYALDNRLAAFPPGLPSLTRVPSEDTVKVSRCWRRARHYPSDC